MKDKYAAAWLVAISSLGVAYRSVAVPAYSRTTSPAERPSWIAELLGTYHSGSGMSLIFFGLHLVVTEWLIARSSYLPRWLGWFFSIDGWAWVVDSIGIYLVPEPHLSFLQVIFSAELVFMVWLLGGGGAPT